MLLYKNADEHLEKISDAIEHLLVAGFTTIRSANGGNQGLGGGEQIKIARACQITELNNQLNPATI